MNDLQGYNSNKVAITHTIEFDTFNRFINYIDASPKTVETYTKALRQLFNYFTFNGITQPKREDILAFRDDLKASGLKPTTVQNYITASRQFFKWTAQEGIYPNIAEHVKGAKLDKNHKKDYLTSRQAKEILASVNRDSEQGLRDYAILSLMITGGFMKIDERNPNTYPIARKMKDHFGNDTNVRRGTNTILSVKTLLENAPTIPTIEEVNNTNRLWRDRIQTPLENALDNVPMLKNGWQYCNAKQEALSEDQLDIPDYLTFSKLYISFEFEGEPDQTERRERKEIKRQKAIKRKEAGKETRYKRTKK